jgi:hypothetical protein
MIVLRGDVEVLGYVKLILMNKLFEEKQKEFILNGYDLILKR